MKAAEYFSRVRSEGESLGLQEAFALRLGQVSSEYGVWLGEDSDSCAVAYFELSSSETTHFSISKVIHVRNVQLEDSDTGRMLPALKVVCVDNRLRDVFSIFLDEVLLKLTEVYSPVAIIKDSADEWRSLLRIANDGLTENGAAGLYGELSYLEDAVAEVGPSALNWWQRSARDLHDFIGTDARVEVKTSAFQARPVVGIHGLRQLDVPEDARLFLAVVEVRKHGQESLDQIVERLLDNGLEATKFLDKLSSAGYVRGMPDASSWKFDVVEKRVWEISESSPVLRRAAVTSEVADSVEDLSYSLALSALGKPSASFSWSVLGSLA